ncbi:Catsper1 [Symbiodinium microadriaticum]|nr:Catsper1 [Symbiodinium sp. KB8]CAE7901830.1 Catsper1 [Symbiodinium microadriaticum]
MSPPGQPQPLIEPRVLLASATLESQEELTPLSGAGSAKRALCQQEHYSALLGRDEEVGELREDAPVLPRACRNYLFMQDSYVLQKNVVGCIVFLNMLMLGLETDGVSWHCWRSSEVLFVLFYCYEISVRICQMGPAALAQALPWEGQASFVFTTDCGLVLLGLGNLIYIACFPGSMPAWMLYTRLVRGLRVFYLFDSLHRFATALSEMFSTLLWIFGVLTFTVYLVAVFLTHYAKHHLFLEGNSEEYFQSILTSMFTLFQVTTMDSWPDIAAPLVEHSVWWRIFFVIFIAFSAWTMISLVTAVVSDNVIQATQDRKEKQKEAMERRRKEFVDFLKVCFVNADTDGNEVLDHQEFATLIKDPQVVAKMEDLGVTLPLQELEKAFAMLDVDEDGELSIDEFTSGLSQLQETLNTKHVVSLDYGLQRVSTQVTKRLEHLEHTVTERSDAIAHSVDKLTTAVAELTDTLKGWRQDASTASRDSKRWLGMGPAA